MSASETELDANWCHIRETLTMLQLSTAQIRSSMQDGDASISELSQSLGAISENTIRLQSAEGSTPTEFSEHVNAISNEVQRGIVACQFHDRVTQRLDHVTEALKHLGDLISSPVEYARPENWQKLQEEIRSSYTMDSERIMFEHITMGASVEEALEIYKHHFDATPEDDTGDEIELF